MCTFSSARFGEKSSSDRNPSIRRKFCYRSVGKPLSRPQILSIRCWTTIISNLRRGTFRLLPCSATIPF